MNLSKLGMDYDGNSTSVRGQVGDGNLTINEWHNTVAVTDYHRSGDLVRCRMMSKLKNVPVKKQKDAKSLRLAGGRYLSPAGQIGQKILYIL
jgi:hypothetical protein